MKLNLITLSLICCSSMSFTPLFADDMADLKKKLQVMQQQMQQMQSIIEAQEKRLKKQQEATQTLVESNPSITKHKPVIYDIADSIAIGGIVEVIAGYSNSDAWSGESSSDILLDTFELGISASAGDWVTGNVLFLYENEDDNDSLLLDEAYVSFANAEKKLIYANVGRLYVPFGNFTTNMVSDPATLTLAETRADVIHLGANLDSGLYTSAYIFNGDAERIGRTDHINNFGANIGYALENDNMELDVGVGYINNIATSGGLVDLVADNPNGATKDYVGGLSFHVGATFSQINLIAEYVTAMDSFNRNELTSVTNDKLKPSALNLEAAYNFSVAGKDTTIALGYQKTKDMYFDTETTDLFEKAWLASISYAVYDNTSLIAQWRHARVYKEVDSALANNADDEDSLLLKLSYEF